MKHLLLVLFVLTLSCNNEDKTERVLIENANKVHPGKALLETNCYVCHSPRGSHGNRLAPPMEAVKMHYLSEGVSKEQFIADIQNWVQNPNEDHARMFGAVRRFGVMAKTPFPEESVKLIADYMYTNDLDKPEQFANRVNEMDNCNK